ncbi:peroxiredoxin-like family protein [Oscillatoria acuminata]|uniref:thioredoxin-dependent peroxiredoxin n=1 Tax=Oscillatoria acuminata PCC 6304 TaxID=56110 RepID=K9THN4_9CYAN|nr:peroxiredoxin-like family protein [Oscillatoria acuminata]AFY82367.1 Peroxiredoxin [Oscillatoria acuminata PCC 6304]
MSLSQDLANLNAQNQSMLPEEAQIVFKEAGMDLLNSGIMEHTLKEGDEIPKFALPNAIGQLVDIQDLLKSGPVVISFYRGGWCPYCSLEFQALQKALPEIQANGATLVAISPETPDNSLSTREKNNLGFEVLSDQGNQVARDFGLVFTVAEKVRPIYKNLGIDLPAANGDETFELPIPATYIVNSDGAIAYSFVSPDYTQRQDPAELITILKNPDKTSKQSGRFNTYRTSA